MFVVMGNYIIPRRATPEEHRNTAIPVTDLAYADFSVAHYSHDPWLTRK